MCHFLLHVPVLNLFASIYSLDTIGIAGFSHDFGTLQGERAKVADVFDSFTHINPKGPSYRSVLLSLFMPVLPLLAMLPTRFTKVVNELDDAMSQISNDLLARTREDMKANHSSSAKGPRSIIEALSACLTLHHDS